MTKTTVLSNCVFWGQRFSDQCFCKVVGRGGTQQILPVREEVGSGGAGGRLDGAFGEGSGIEGGAVGGWGGWGEDFC